eukprot:TRINITY_DN8820_c0_g1_i1.p1 TRINITY_DN8820_c0_g1~~TRINITY_DN8820_c0_g1_i1.p1  ORF type:complete len:217 (-),score=22.33 TRINITY_DN8820_c0_g1_i1:132-782(-)
MKPASICFINFFNLVLTLVGLVLVGYTSYLLYTSLSHLSWFLFGNAAFVLLCGVFGLLSVRVWTSKCFLYFYIVVLTLLVTWEGVVVVGYFVAEDTANTWFDFSTSDKDSIESFKHTLNDHKWTIKGIFAAFFVYQVIVLFLTCCMGKNLIIEAFEDEDHGVYIRSNDDDLFLRASTSKQTPMTDNSRELMVAKYGSRYEKRRNTVGIEQSLITEL